MSERQYYEMDVEGQYDDKECPVVVLEGPIPGRLKGLSLIREDLKQVNEILDELVAEETTSVSKQKGLLFGALALYGKCFTQAKGRGTQLNADSFFKKAPCELQEHHKWMMRLRHQFVAHGGDAQEEQLKILLVLSPDESEKKVLDLIGHGASAHNLEEHLIKQCRETVDFAIEKVSKQVNELQKKLLKLFEGEGLDWAYENSIKRSGL